MSTNSKNSESNILTEMWGSLLGVSKAFKAVTADMSATDGTGSVAAVTFGCGS